MGLGYLFEGWAIFWGGGWGSRGGVKAPKTWGGSGTRAKLTGP